MPLHLRQARIFTVCRSGWLIQFLQVCAAGTKVPHTPLLFPNQINLKLKCGYSTIWVAGGQGAGTDSKTASLSGGKRALNSEVTPREGWGLHLVGKDNTEM